MVGGRERGGRVGRNLPGLLGIRKVQNVCFQAGRGFVPDLSEPIDKHLTDRSPHDR